MAASAVSGQTAYAEAALPTEGELLTLETVTPFEASIEAELLFAKAGPAWRAWVSGPGGRSGWILDLGIRPDGTPPDPMDPIAFAVAVQMCLETLRRCRRVHLSQYAITMVKGFEAPGRAWHTPWGTGLADSHHLTTIEARVLLERGKQCLWQQMEGDGCRVCGLPSTS